MAEHSPYCSWPCHELWYVVPCHVIIPENAHSDHCFTVDHPHGGGRGKSKGNRHPTSPWGTPVSNAASGARLGTLLNDVFYRPREGSRLAVSTTSTSGLLTPEYATWAGGETRAALKLLAHFDCGPGRRGLNDMCTEHGKKRLEMLVVNVWHTCICIIEMFALSCRLMTDALCQDAASGLTVTPLSAPEYFLRSSSDSHPESCLM